MLRRKTSDRDAIFRNRPPRDKYPLLRRFLIITEGQTEVAYFNSFKNRQGPIIIRTICGNGQDKQRLVELARQKREEYQKQGYYDEELDEVWVVFDRDIKSDSKTDKQSFNSALESATKHNIRCAYSNDLFEVWLLLHFQYIESRLSRPAVKQKLKELFLKIFKIDYDKHKTDKEIYYNLRSKLSAATDNAEKLLLKHLRDETPPLDANPSTTVHELINHLCKNINV